MVADIELWPATTATPNRFFRHRLS